MLKKVLKSIIACSLAVGLLIGSGNEVVQAREYGQILDDGSCTNENVRVFYQGEEKYISLKNVSIFKESLESDWGYGYGWEFGVGYPVIIVGLDGFNVLDGAVIYPMTKGDFDIMRDDNACLERLQRSTPYLKSCDFDLVVMYEW